MGHQCGDTKHYKGALTPVNTLRVDDRQHIRRIPLTIVNTFDDKVLTIVTTPKPT